jgi:hypothetical protein
METVTALLLFVGSALHRWVYIIDMSLLIIAHLLLLRALDSSKVSRRQGDISNEDGLPVAIHS